MASKSSRIQVNVTAYEKKKRLQAAREMLDMKLGRIDAQTWSTHMLDLLEELKENGYYSIECQLFEAYVYVTKDQKEEARQGSLLDSLEKNQRMLQEEELEGAFLYLNECSERSTQLKENVTARLRQLRSSVE